MTSVFNWQASDGVTIYAREWKPEIETKAVIAFAHGLGEHIERYHHVAEYFNSHGIAFVANDHHGHGQTTGKKGHIRKFELFYEELDTLLEECATRFPGKPIFLYGHSMGGLIVLDYMVTRKPAIAGVISSAAAIKLAFEPSAALVFLGKITRSIFPSFTQNNGLDANNISRDEAVVKAYIADPLVHDKISSQLGLSMLEEGRKLQKFNGKLCCPLLIMHGTGDKLTSEEGSAAFAHNAKGDILYRSFEGLYHEIHNEPEKEQVLKTIWDWMESILKVQK